MPQWPVLCRFVAKDQVFFPCAHGVALHQAVRVFAEHACLGPDEQQLPGKKSGRRWIRDFFFHPFRVDKEPIDEVGGFSASR